MLYTHIPFFRFFGYENIIIQAPELISLICNYEQRIFSPKNKYVTFYFRNSSEKIFEIFSKFYEIFKNNGYEIIIFGENKAIIENNDIIYTDIKDGEQFTFIEKIYIMSNSNISFTGRGGFALLPLFNKKHTFSFFDEQGVSEFNSGLWDFSLWRNNVVNTPFFPHDKNYLDIVNNNLHDII